MRLHVFFNVYAQTCKTHKKPSLKYDKLQIRSNTSLSSPSRKTIKKNRTDHRGAKGI